MLCLSSHWPGPRSSLLPLSKPETPAPAEDMTHLLVTCRATATTRTRLMPELLNIIASQSPNNELLTKPNHAYLAQLILDPTSLNLPSSIRISQDHPGLQQLLPMCRTICYAIYKDRLRQLKQSGHKWVLTNDLVHPNTCNPYHNLSVWQRYKRN